MFEEYRDKEITDIHLIETALQEYIIYIITLHYLHYYITLLLYTS
jgi:hypothetical protein